MNTLFEILVYVWIGISAMMVVTLFLRRRSMKAERAADPEAVKLNLPEPKAGADEESAETTPHPALVEADAKKTGASDINDADAGDDEPTNLFATTTTDTLDVVVADDESTEVAEPEPAAESETEQSASDKSAIDDHNDNYKDDASDSEAPDQHLSGNDELPHLEPRTLIDMLDGIELPYDLTPVTVAVEDPDRHLIFLTTHSNAEEVGTRFADEMIRLGYEFSPVGLDQAIASRNGDMISMTIVPEAANVDEGNGPRYGAAGQGDVALELWVGDAPTPPRR